ncbi:MAG: ABC transporter substrate-binding protein [Halanaeroarchaeum sp.]
MPDGTRTIRRRAVLSGIGVGIAGLAGCTGNQGQGGDGGDGTTTTSGGGTTTTGSVSETKLTIAGLWSGAEEKDFQQVLEYVESEAAVTTEYHPRTTSSLKSGTLMDYTSGVATADVVIMPWTSRIRSDAKSGHLSPMGGLWKGENYAVSQDQVSTGGSVYGAPFKMDLKPGFWHRQSFFEDHGLSEPDSYDEFKTLLETISQIEGVDAPMASGGGAGWPLSDQVEAYFLRQQNGAALQRGLISGEADFTDQRVQSAFDEVKRLLQADRFSKLRPFSIQYQYMWDGSTPLYFMGSWTPTMGPVKDPSDLGVFRLPGVEGMVGSVNWLTVPTYSDNVQTAKQVADLITSKAGQRIWAKRGGFIASHTGVPQSAYQLEIMAKMSQLASDVTIVPDLDDSLGNPFQTSFWAQLKGLWTSPSTDLTTILQTLENKQDASLSS